jgi:hypothetical protein
MNDFLVTKLGASFCGVGVCSSKNGLVGRPIGREFSVSPSGFFAKVRRLKSAFSAISYI